MERSEDFLIVKKVLSQTRLGSYKEHAEAERRAVQRERAMEEIVRLVKFNDLTLKDLESLLGEDFFSSYRAIPRALPKPFDPFFPV